jgi:hypothetical protein
LEKIGEISVIANKLDKKKILIVRETAEQVFPPVFSWGMGFESMIYSTLKGIDSTINIYVVDTIDLRVVKYQNPDIHFAVPWSMFWEIDELNPHYFKLPKQLPSELALEDGEIKIKDLSFEF